MALLCQHPIENKQFLSARSVCPSKRHLPIFNSSERYLTSQRGSHAPCSCRVGMLVEGFTWKDFKAPQRILRRLGLQFGYLANSLAQLLESRDVSSSVIVRRRKHRWPPHQPSCKRRSSVVRARTAPQGAVWRPGRSFACELTLTAIYTAPFTSGTSVRSRVEARRTSHENSRWLWASRHMPTW